jgi:acyl-CoA dehydrogenase
MTVVFILAAIVAFGQSLYVGRPLLGFLAATGIVLLAWVATGVGSWTAFAVVAAIPLTVAALFGLPLLRRPLLSKRLMAALSGLLPRMGETERIALEAGTVWWDGELFSGDPDWQQLLAFQPRGLSEAEQAFLDGPVEELCRMLDDWQIWQDRAIPDEIWDYLKKERFFGMIIPREHGGLGFSAIAHSAVVAKVTSRSVPTVCALMVPNSLGPAELLLLYGTEAQRQHYLPRLATGEEIPCFALTEPHAGSDAAAPRSRGVVCRGRYDGEEVVGIRLDWDKRYITLAPVATLIGLAFHLSDPEGLLGGAAEPGITCALVPHHLPGIDIGAHHDPLGVPFPNGPIKGKGVFIPIDFVIGGREGVGNGWRMLMNCLAAGRSISLPSLSVGAAQLATRTVGAYGTVREQFGLPIGRFEGIEEALARIAGHTYLMNAARVITCGAVDAGEKPAVISGIVKAYLTQAMRDVLSDAMDIQAGAGICRGPNNILGRGFSSVPLGITVEGANILTRSMIVYGQGAIRCHPYLSAEMRAIEEKDLAAFDRAFFGHLTFAARNVVRALVLGLTGARWVRAPVSGFEARTYRALTRQSAVFALAGDACMAILGGDLKRREKISGRMADALAWMYLASCVLKHFHDEGRPDSDRPVVEWACALALWRGEQALHGVFANLPGGVLPRLLRALAFPFGPSAVPPPDSLGASVAQDLLGGGTLRERLTRDIFVPEDEDWGLGRLEAALEAVVAAAAADGKVRAALRAGTLTRAPAETLAGRAREAAVIDDDELALLLAAEKARDAVIAVDVFDPQSYRALRG